MIWVTGASALITLASMIVAIVACVDARKSRKAAEKSATISADLYKQGRVKFSLHRTNNTMTRMLANDGTHTAHDVSVTAPAAPDFKVGINQAQPVELGSGTQIKITANAPGGLRDRRVIVRYRETPDGPEKTFTVYA